MSSDDEHNKQNNNNTNNANKDNNSHSNTATTNVVVAVSGQSAHHDETPEPHHRPTVTLPQPYNASSGRTPTQYYQCLYAATVSSGTGRLRSGARALVRGAARDTALSDVHAFLRGAVLRRGAALLQDTRDWLCATTDAADSASLPSRLPPALAQLDLLT